MLKAGAYTFLTRMPDAAPAGLDHPWRALLESPDTRAAVGAHFPRALRGIAFQGELVTLRQLTETPFSELTRDEVAALARQLAESAMVENE